MQMPHRFKVVIDYGVLGCRGMYQWGEAERHEHAKSLVRLLQPGGSLLLKGDVHRFPSPKAWLQVHRWLTAWLDLVSVVEDRHCTIERFSRMRTMLNGPVNASEPVGCPQGKGEWYEYSQWIKAEALP